MTPHPATTGSIVRPLPRLQHRRSPVDVSIGLDSGEEVAGAPYLQGALALTYALDNGLDAVPRSSALSLVQPAAERCTTTIPDPERWAARFLQAVVEVVANDRPLTQLARWTAEQVYAEIGRRQQRVAAHRRAGQLRAGRQQVATVHLCQTTPDSAEVAARVCMGSRSRAVAARLDYVRDRWVCTAICFG